MPQTSRPARLVTLSDVLVEAASSDEFGRRAATLARALRHGVPLLETRVLPAEVFRGAVAKLLPPGHEPAALIRLADRSQGLEAVARARERLRSAALEDLLEGIPQQVLDQLGESGELAVLSSPSIPDLALSRLAGLEWLGTSPPEPHALIECIRSAWCRVFNEQAMRLMRAQRVRDLSMAVVFVSLPRVHASGTILARDPRPPPGEAEPNVRPKRIVRATLGLGPPVVDGTAPGDILLIDADGAVTHQQLAIKSRRLMHGVLQPVADAEARGPALDAAALVQLGKLGAALDAHGEGTVAEFVVASPGGVWVLDVYPQRGRGVPAGGAEDTVWSRSAVGDLLPARPTPLTWSVLENFAKQGLRGALKQAGVSLPRSAPIVRRVNGRLYVNLSLLVPALASTPDMDSSALLELAPGEGAASLRAKLADHKAPSLARLSLLTTRLAAHKKRLADDVQRFEREAEQQRRWLSEMDLAILPDDALKTTLRECYEFFVRTGQLMFGCSLTALGARFGLRAVIARGAPAQAERLIQEVSAGVGQLESALMSGALAQVAAIISRDGPARELVAAGGNLGALPEGPGRRALQQFLGAYGDRALGEAELAAPRWNEDQQALSYMVQALMHVPDLDPEAILSRVRVQADGALAQLESELNFIETRLARVLLNQARELFTLCDVMRSWMARVAGMFRRVVLDIDRRLRRLDRNLEAGSAFYLSYAELLSAAGSVRADLAPIVALRRAELEADASLLDPPESFVGSPPNFTLPPLQDALRGAAAAGGVVEATARIVDATGQGIGALRPGEVLVTRSPDLALGPILPMVGALVAELGGKLSHAAILAREYGIPAVLGVAGATVGLRDGDRVRVDGDRGLVERLES